MAGRAFESGEQRHLQCERQDSNRDGLPCQLVQVAPPQKSHRARERTGGGSLAGSVKRLERRTMRPSRLLRLAGTLLLTAAPLRAQSLPKAIFTDPPRDSLYPARGEVIALSTGGVVVKGMAYLPSGADVKPTFVFLHGFPGNERNFDLVQAIRRAGWNALAIGYRGAWGNPGTYSFAHNIEDVKGWLRWLRDPATVKRLGIDTTRVVLAGHSMGGWLTALAAVDERGLLGAALISASDMPVKPRGDSAQTSAFYDGAVASALAGTTGTQLREELAANRERWHLTASATRMPQVPMLVLSSDDGNAPSTDSLVVALRAGGNRRITTAHVATDHSWNDRRIELQARVINWLDALLAGR
jgi:pimeloyl-ACP methyl ester carboxylesterase